MVMLIKKNIKFWKQVNKNGENVDFCCIQGEFLFHNITELKEFSNKKDFFLLDDDK